MGVQTDYSELLTEKKKLGKFQLKILQKMREDCQLSPERTEDRLLLKIGQVLSQTYWKIQILSQENQKTASSLTTTHPTTLIYLCVAKNDFCPSGFYDNALVNSYGQYIEEKNLLVRIIEEIFNLSELKMECRKTIKINLYIFPHTIYLCKQTEFCEEPNNAIRKRGGYKMNIQTLCMK